MNDHRRNWPETERLLRAAIGALPLSEKETAAVIEYVDHNEFGVAYDWIVWWLAEMSVTPSAEAQQFLKQANYLMHQE